MTKRFGSIRLRELYVWYVKSKGRGKAKATIGPKRAWMGLFAPNHLRCRVLKLPWPRRQWRWPSCTLLQGRHCTDGGPWNPEYLTFRSGKCQLHGAINPRFIFWYVNILHFGWNFNLKKKYPMFGSWDAASPESHLGAAHLMGVRIGKTILPFTDWTFGNISCWRGIWIQTRHVTLQDKGSRPKSIPPVIIDCQVVSQSLMTGNPSAGGENLHRRKPAHNANETKWHHLWNSEIVFSLCPARLKANRSIAWEFPVSMAWRKNQCHLITARKFARSLPSMRPCTDKTKLRNLKAEKGILRVSSSMLRLISWEFSSRQVKTDWHWTNQSTKWGEIIPFRVHRQIECISWSQPISCTPLSPWQLHGQTWR